MLNEKRKNPNAVALGRLGAKARQEKLTPEQRRAIAQNAIRVRWQKVKERKVEESKNGYLQVGGNQPSLTDEPSAQTHKPDAIAATELSPAELFQQCKAAERSSATLDIQKLKLIFTKYYFFEADHFPPFRTRTATTSRSIAERARNLRIDAALHDGSKYHWLLELLRKAPDKRARLIILAWWSKEEKICAPEEIIGRDELKRLGNKLWKGLSSADLRHAGTVKAWLPYFTQILQHLRPFESREKLVSMGYDKAAVTASLRKRSPVSAACEFLANRSHIDQRRLANAYSGIYGRK